MGVINLGLSYFDPQSSALNFVRKAYYYFLSISKYANKVPKPITANTAVS